MSDRLAASIRDQILDQIVGGETGRAMETYRRATGADSAEAERIVLRLQDLLQASGELSAADQVFLDNFRAGLRPISSTDLLDFPHAEPAKQLMALGSYVLLALLTFNVVCALILLITGSVGFWVNPWAGLFAAILLAGPMFIAFPGILRGLVVRRLRAEGFVRSPGFGWEVALGFVLVIGGILGSVLSERLVWLSRAEVVEIAAPASLGLEEIDRSAILWIQSSKALDLLVGTLTETRRDRHGNVSRSEYLVQPLVNTDVSPERVAQSDLCVWVGISEDAFSRFQHPVLDPSSDSPYFVDNPSHRSEYEEAVANALGDIGSGDTSLPDCTRVLERVPHPDVLRSALLSKLRVFGLTVNGAFGVLLGVWAVAWIVRRLKASVSE